MCTCMWIYAHEGRYPQKPGALGPLELAAVTDGYESPDMEFVFFGRASIAFYLSSPPVGNRSETD